MKIAALVSLALLAPVAADAQSIKLANPGFEQAAKTADEIPGWRPHQHAGEPSYEFAIDKKVAAKGKASFRLTRLLEQDYGALDQILPAGPLIGKEIEFSANVKTKDVGRRGFVLCINFTDSADSILQQFRSAPRMTGTTDKWTPVSLAVKVPAGVQKIEIGFLLIDSGTAWADDAALRIVPDGTVAERSAKDKAMRAEQRAEDRAARQAERDEKAKKKQEAEAASDVAEKAKKN